MHQAGARPCPFDPTGLRFRGGRGKINFYQTPLNPLSNSLAEIISRADYSRIKRALIGRPFPRMRADRRMDLHAGNEKTIHPGTMPQPWCQTGMDAREESLMDQAVGLPAGGLPSHAPTMGKVAKVSYTHLDMIDFMLANPGCTLNQIAARYGYTPGWICNVQASDAFKAAFAARREQLVDPILHKSLNEHFEGITRLSLERLQERLEQPAVSDNVILRAVELGAKALGVGGNAPPPPPQQDHLARLANRLLELQANIRKGVTFDGTAQEVPVGD